MREKSHMVEHSTGKKTWVDDVTGKRAQYRFRLHMPVCTIRKMSSIKMINAVEAYQPNGLHIRVPQNRLLFMTGTPASTHVLFSLMNCRVEINLYDRVTHCCKK